MIKLITKSVASIFVAMLLLAMPAAQASEPTETVFGTAPRIHQIAFTVTDLSRAIEFYRDTLSLPYMFTANGMAFFDLAGTRLMIATDDRRPAAARPKAILYIDTSDFHGSVALLRERGVEFVAPIETVTELPEGTLMLAEFRDPDGNAVAAMGIVPRS
ncbi:VOC family protein [Erythrobacter sp. W53]|uniref:VOC family protein n=1 Tax=Erythrobacter sp. W53 TaxID=3425947 RepID=UPI003D768DE0